MRKVKIITLFFALTLLLSACNTQSAYIEKPNVENENNKITVNQVENETVSYSYGCANMSIVIPKSWEYSITEFSSVTDTFGIGIKPVGMDGEVGIYYYRNGFGVCGTGLDSKPIDISENLSGTVGIYDESEIWNFITLNNVAGPYVIIVNGDVEPWWNDNYEMLMSILGTIEVGKGQMTNDEAIEIASKLCPENYKNLYPSFDVENGSWSIPFADDSFTNEMTVNVDANGNAEIMKG